MSQVLSQNEVDALLTAVMDGDMDEEEIEEEPVEQAAAPAPEVTPAPAPMSHIRTVNPDNVRPYDLTNQDRIMRGKMPMLEVLHDKFCRDFRSVMSMDLRRMVDIEPGRIRLIKFREFLNSLPVPSCLSLFTMEPLTGSGLITFDSEFIFLLVDLFCGGLGKTRFRIEGREFTSIEQGIVGKVVIRALAQMSDAWEALYPVTVNFTRTEINPQFINLAHPTEIVVRFTAAIDIEGVGGTMSIVLPYSMIEPIKGKLERGVIGERIELERIWRESMEGKIIESDVDMTGVLGKLNLSIGKLIKLKVDDILELDTGVDDLMTVEVQGRPKFYGRTGRHKGYKAVQILEVAE